MNLIIILIFILLSYPPVFGAEKGDIVDYMLNQIEQKQMEIERSDGEPVQSPPAGPAIHENIDRLSFHQTPLESVFARIEKETGFILVMEESVSGEFTGVFENIIVWDALRLIVDQNSLAYYERNGVVYIMSGSTFESRYGLKFDETVQSAIVPVRFADPEALSLQLKTIKSANGRVYLDRKERQLFLIDTPVQLGAMKEFVSDKDVFRLTKEVEVKNFEAPELVQYLTADPSHGAAEISFDPRSNRVILKGTVSQVNSMENKISAIDRRQDIVFKTTVIRIDLDDDHLQGVDWEAVINDFRKVEVAGTGLNEDYVCFGIIPGEDYSVLLGALDLIGDMESYSVPEFQSASRSKSYLRLNASDEHFSADWKVPELDFQIERENDKGLSFFITPRIHLDGRMRVSIETPAALREHAVDLELKKGDGLVIGHIFQEKDISVSGKVPLLGDLPFVGGVFRHKNTDLQKFENIIFVIPEFKRPDPGI